jgi:uncharacterized membrane protein
MSAIGPKQTWAGALHCYDRLIWLGRWSSRASQSLLEELSSQVGGFLRDGSRTGDWQSAYPNYRSNIGRGILLGLELLVGADIIATITAPLTILSVGLLAGIVLIRTFLSFSLETEIGGCWPWQRAAKDALRGERDQR